MDVREKLVELIDSARYWGCGTSEEIAQNLIANGVTVQDNTEISDELLERLRNAPITVITEETSCEVVQEWISVNDRLPEIVSTNKRYGITIKKSIRVLCVCVQKSGKTMVKEGYCEWRNDYPEPIWQIPGTIDEVTHWMPLPEPPKGD